MRMGVLQRKPGASASKSVRVAPKPQRRTTGATKLAAKPAVTRSGARSAGLRGDLAYLKLREEIREGRLQPGDRLREIELAERFAVSRTPIREALKRLVAEGLVVFSQPRGLTVAEL